MLTKKQKEQQKKLHDNYRYLRDKINAMKNKIYELEDIAQNVKRLDDTLFKVTSTWSDEKKEFTDKEYTCKAISTKCYGGGLDCRLITCFQIMDHNYNICLSVTRLPLKRDKYMIEVTARTDNYLNNLLHLEKLIYPKTKIKTASEAAKIYNEMQEKILKELLGNKALNNFKNTFDLKDDINLKKTTPEEMEKLEPDKYY
jgi:hypothetical protein